ncbi:MAG: MBL fold metallo-hydrolase [Sedimentisphaerales bacterium]|nr:MBL fold metallo-hydrolase [Sedimentisphaerales bacterium]
MEIKLTFLGAAQNVTGSRYLVQVDGANVLVDCGLYQERQFRERNWDEFYLPPGQLDAVLLTHAHVDHCGLLPKLVKEGFKGKIFCTTATSEIAQVVLLDSAHLQEEDAAYKKKRHKKEGRTGAFPEEPLYKVEDAENCNTLFVGVDYETPVEVAAGMRATFYDAGHILGSAMIKLKVNSAGEKRTILFSGDIGRKNKPIIQDPSSFEHADYILVESTYGDRDHEPVEDVKDSLAEVVNSTREAGGNICVPSFAIERSQELLYYLNELLDEKRIEPIMTCLDSPMAIRVTEIFKRHPEMYDEEMIEMLGRNKSPFDFPGLNMTVSTTESKAINSVRGTIMIIAGSGMCTGGRIKHHLVNNIARPESTLLFVGYQAVGTLGRTILDGPEEVRILGQKYPIKARVARIRGFSAHADRNEIFTWLSSIKNHPKKVFITHGEADAAKSFKGFLDERIKWETYVPEYREQVVLD